MCELITDSGLGSIEKLLEGGRTISDRTATKIAVHFPSLMDLVEAKEKCQEAGLKIMVRDKSYLDFTHDQFRTLLTHFLSPTILSDFKVERVWETKKEYTLTSEMSHQRLSNCVGLLESLLESGKISKPDADIYLERLKPVIEELKERFNEEILEYVPYYDWEKLLIK